MNKIYFHDTHASPGCLAVFFFRIAAGYSTLSALAEFSDGSTADAEIEQINPEEAILRIDSYDTAQGTTIAEKTWRLKFDYAQDLWKVVSKI